MEGPPEKKVNGAMTSEKSWIFGNNYFQNLQNAAYQKIQICDFNKSISVSTDKFNSATPNFLQECDCLIFFINIIIYILYIENSHGSISNP